MSYGPAFDVPLNGITHIPSYDNKLLQVHGQPAADHFGVGLT